MTTTHNILSAETSATSHEAPLTEGDPNRHRAMQEALLMPLPRAPERAALAIAPTLPFRGHDVWNHYEMSWLNQRGKPQVALAEIVIPCESPYLIESSSMKRYFDSLNNIRFDSAEHVEAHVAQAVSQCVGSHALVRITPLRNAARLLTPPEGECIDFHDVAVGDTDVNPHHLCTIGDTVVEARVYSELMKSRCRVTGTPDWGTVWITYRGRPICGKGLLRYVLSFRNHDDFHEHCIERIFVDVMRQCSPEKLTVGGRFIRRNGIDINPVRSTEAVSISNSRAVRK